jgi:hypothetical protein
MNKSFKPTNGMFLDTDTDPKINKGSDFILNTIFTSDGRRHLAVNYKGNEQVFSSDIHTQSCTLLGWCVDNARNRVIMFLTSSDNDSIEYYEPSTNSTGIVLQYKSILNFNSNFKIFNPKIIGDLLYFTDGYNEPKKVNYIRAINYTNGQTTGYTYTSMDKNTLDAYKRPGIPFYVTPNYSSSGTGTLIGKSYQWAYRFIYFDGEKSVLSEATSIYFTDTNVFPNGVTTQDLGVYQYDLVNFNINFIYENDIVSTEIYVRDNESSDWFLYDTLIQSNNFLNYTFDDKKLRVQADQNDLSRPFDFLPALAVHQELIEKNRLIYPNITEGFDPVNINATVNLVYTPAPNLTWKNDFGFGHVLTTGGYNYIWWDDYNINVMFGIHITKNLFVQLNPPALVFDITSSTIDIRYTRKAIFPNDGYVLGSFIDQLKQYGITAGYVTSIPTTPPTNLNGIRFVAPSNQPGAGAIIYDPIFPFSYKEKPTYKTLKTGDTYLGGIQYYDKNFKFSSVNKFNTPINVPDTQNPNVLESIISLNISVKNLPPIDAYYWSPVFTKRTKKGYYLQFLVQNSNWQPSIDFVATEGNLHIKINNIINSSHDLNPNCNIGTYIFEKGDRLRLLGKTSWNGVSSFPPPVHLFPYTNYDAEIIGMEWPSGDLKYQKDQATIPAYITDANGNKVSSGYSEYIVVPMNNDLVISNNSNYLFEIYRPLKTAEKLFYFPCGMFSIGNPGTSNAYHTGNAQNQNPANPSNVPAIVNCNPGDTYLKMRDMRYVFVCTDDNYSDYYPSNFIGTGRPNIYDINAKRATYKSAMRYSEILIENTRTNNLNQFWNNFTNLKSEFGSINYIHEVGDVLKVLQDKKETSVYVAKEELTTASGQDILRANSNIVLGNQKRMDEIRGTTHPRSVVIHNRDMYYWDGNTGEVIRTSPNGQIPISKYGMEAYFKNLTGYTDVIAGWDQQNELFMITFTGSYPVTLGFYEPKLDGEQPRWISFFSFIPACYLYFGNWFATYVSLFVRYPDFYQWFPTLWKHNSNSVVRCNFYGVKHKQQINIIFNENAATKKIFRNIGIESNKKWDIPAITIEPDSSYFRGFLSKIPVGRFILKEGKFWANYLKNMLTRSNTPSNLDLINGDEIRGLYIKHELVNSEDEEVWLLGVQIDFDVSNNY